MLAGASVPTGQDAPTAAGGTDFPPWVLKNTGVFGAKGRWHIQGVGAGKQRTAAHERARDEVMKVVQVMVRELLKDYAATSTAADSEAGRATMEQSYAAILKEVARVSPEMPEHWVHADGTVYALARFELTLLLEVMDRAGSVTPAIRDYIRRSADDFFADLQALQ